MSKGPVKILLAEDDDIDAELIERAFSHLKVSNPIIRAKDGLDALEIMGQDEHRISSPYIILADLNMPRMGGIELIREIRQRDDLSRSIVFVLTTSESEEDKIKAYDLNVAGYLIKSCENKFMSDLGGFLENYWKLIEMPYQ